LQRKTPPARPLPTVCVCVCVCVCVSVCVCVKDMCAYARTYVRPNMLPRERSWEA
jgi:hypothetical protein